MPATGRQPPSDAVIPRTKHNASGEDVSRAVIMRGRGPKNPVKSTSSKSIILRHGRHGIWGDGQLATFKKLSGQEKLALKAEELMKNAVLPPFNLDKLRRTVVGQFGEQIDKIRELRDVETFHDTVDAYIESHPRRKPQKEDKLPGFVTRVIGSRIHNAYLLAATWKIIRDALHDLKERGLKDTAVPDQLKCDEGKRDSYLLIWDCVSMLLECGLQELKTDVAGSEALGKYFATTDAGVATFSPTNAVLMSAHRSLIDATILELVLPHSTYPPHILFAILSDALSTTPHEEVRKFSQAVVDELGNLSILIEMRNMLEGPILAAGDEGKAWKEAPRRDPEGEGDAFYDAMQKSSTVAPLKANEWQHLVWPLHQTKNEIVLQSLWEAVDTAYLDVTSCTVDELWQLEADRLPRAQWLTWEIPELADYEDISSEEEQGDATPNTNGTAAGGSKGKSKKRKDIRPDALVRKRRARGGANPNRQAITAGQGEDDDDDGMPGLMSCSSSEEDLDALVEGEEGERTGDAEWGSDVESDYDPHEKRVLERLMKEAQNTASAGWTSGTGKKDSNPFIRLLSNLRGRMFNTDPTLRPSKLGPQAPAANIRPPSATYTTRVQVQTNKFFPLEMPDPAMAKKQQPSTPSKKSKEEDEDDLPSLVGEKVRVKATSGAAATANDVPAIPLPKAPTVRTAAGKVTVEEAEDVGDIETGEAKKKRQKKKRPKKKETVQRVPGSNPPRDRTTPSTQTSPTPGVYASSTIDVSTFSGPSISLTQPAPVTAQSARAYIASKGLAVEPKSKTKTRADPSASSEQPKEKKKGFFSRFTRRNQEKAKEKDAEEEGGEAEKKKGGFRSGLKPKLHLPHKAASLIGRLLGGKADEKKGQAGMKWEHFVKAMKLLGFQEVRGTEGSSVRFDPPSDLDHPITFHKPHPDSTIHPKMLIKFGKRLKAHYGWDEEQFSAAVNLDFIDEDLD